MEEEGIPDGSEWAVENRFPPTPALTPRELLERKLNAGGIVHLSPWEEEEWARVVREAQAAQAVVQNKGMEPWKRALAGDDDAAWEKAITDMSDGDDDGEDEDHGDEHDEDEHYSPAPSAAMFRPADDVAALDAEEGWRPSEDQEKAIAVLLGALRSPGVSVFSGAAGCHPAGTRVLLSSGETRAVEKICVGDQLVGDDGGARTVVKLVQGYGPLFRIVPVKGNPFIVNEDHVLTLVHSGDKYGRGVKAKGGKPCHYNGELIDVSLRAVRRSTLRSHKLLRVPVQEFKATHCDLPLDPYFLGVLLGDGCYCNHGGSTVISISKPDAEIEECAMENAAKFNMSIRVCDRGNGNNSYIFRNNKGAKRGEHHRGQLRLVLERLALWDTRSGERFIPSAYLTATYTIRAAVLAGLLDTDGHKMRGGGYDYISQSERLAQDVAFVARSLGLAAYVTPCQKGCQTGAVGDYFRVSISGDARMLPMRIPRKQPDARRQKKSVLRTGIARVEPVGSGMFYGFTLDGNGRYLLDDFTVTHNCGKSVCCRAILRHLSPAWDVVLVAPTWRAANRLTEATGQRATSIHHAIYGKPVQERLCPCGAWAHSLMDPVKVAVQVPGDGEGLPAVTLPLPRYVCSECATAHEDATRFEQRLNFVLKDSGGGGDGPTSEYRLVIVDEAGMVGGGVVADLERAFLDGRTRILYVGDANQLGPVVGDGDRAAALPPIDLTRPTAAIHRVHRQAAGSPALSLAHTLKVTPEMSQVAWPFPRRLSGVDIQQRVRLDEPARWAAAHRKRGAPHSHALIAYSNKTRAALNGLVREHTGARAYADFHQQNVIVGDLLLMRGNSAGAGVYNGELWVVEGWDPVLPSTRMLDEWGRMSRAKPLYEHDRVLGSGVGVFHAALGRVGSRASDPSTRAILVLPIDSRGAPMLESDIIRGGADAFTARERMRSLARAWSEEYAKGIEDHTSEFERAQRLARDKLIALARLEEALRRGDRDGAVEQLKRLLRAAGRRAEAEAQRLMALAGMGEPIFVEEVKQAFASEEDVALDCANVQVYCERVHGALDPTRVVVADFGECLTCHSMQGDQAANVAVVFDGAFWWMWKDRREEGLRWAYTAITRTSGQLALFSISKGG